MVWLIFRHFMTDLKYKHMQFCKAVLVLMICTCRLIIIGLVHHCGICFMYTWFNTFDTFSSFLHGILKEERQDNNN